MVNVIKRNGERVNFDENKIYMAIYKAMKYGSGLIDESVISDIISEIKESVADKSEVTIREIEDLVYIKLIKYNHEMTAKAYEGFRAIHEFKRETNTTDESIIGLVNSTNTEVMTENSNKDSILIPTQRDLIAGEVSKDIVRRKKLPTRLVQAHDEGVLHFHDLDYFLQPMHNCDLINIKDMLDNGTVINKRLIESPKSFQTACTVLTQIIAQVASSQYGGQSIAIKHLGKYLKRSEDKYYKLLKDDVTDVDELNKIVDKMLQRELAAGIQTIQYQINTLMTTNG